MFCLRNIGIVSRWSGDAAFVPGHLIFDTSFTSNMSELTFSFFDCTPVPQEPLIQISYDFSTHSDFTLIHQTVRRFTGWITVSAVSVFRKVVRAFRRVVCEAKVLFNRRVFILQGGLRL